MLHRNIRGRPFIAYARWGCNHVRLRRGGSKIYKRKKGEEKGMKRLLKISQISSSAGLVSAFQFNMPLCL